MEFFVVLYDVTPADDVLVGAVVVNKNAETQQVGDFESEWEIWRWSFLYLDFFWIIQKTSHY